MSAQKSLDIGSNSDLPPPYEGTEVDPSFDRTDLTGGARRHILLMVTGAATAIQIPDIVRGLSESPSVVIRVVLSTSALRILSTAAITSISHVQSVYSDTDWITSQTESNLSTELWKWTEILIIAPLSANTLAKVANGIGDTLVTSIVRTWHTECDLRSHSLEDYHPGKFLIVAPSMDLAAWYHPVTRRQLKTVSEEWMEFRSYRKGPDNISSPGISNFSSKSIEWAIVVPPSIAVSQSQGQSESQGDGAAMNVKKLLSEVSYTMKKYY